MSDEFPPKWAAEGFAKLERQGARLEARLSNVEQAVIAGASASGASAGRKWGAIISAIVMGISTMLAQCDAPANPAGDCEAGICKTLGSGGSP